MMGRQSRKDSWFYNFAGQVLEVKLDRKSSGAFTYLPGNAARFSWIASDCLFKARDAARSAPNARFRGVAE